MHQRGRKSAKSIAGTATVQLSHSVCRLQVSSLDQSDLRKFGEELVAQLLIETTQCSLMSPFLSKIKVRVCHGECE